MRDRADDTAPGQAYGETRGDDDFGALLRPPAPGPATLAGNLRCALPDRRRAGRGSAGAASGKAERSGRSPVRVAARQWGRGAAASAPLFRARSTLLAVDGQLARDAMVSEPLALEVGATATEAGEVLSRDAVRAVLVIDQGRLVGVVTRKTLVREVVASGRDPARTTLGEIAEEPNATIDSAMPLDLAFAFLEQQDYERVPVVDDGKLVGVLSRAVVRRRLAEDEPPAESDL